MQFPRDANAVDQFFRQQTPDTGEEPMTPEHRMYLGKTMAELIEQTGPAVLITHSNSGQYGWYAAIASDPGMIKAVVAYEPGAFTFPEGERPADIPAKAEMVDLVMEPRMVAMDDFLKLTTMPIIIIYGDNIASEPSEIFNVDLWRVASARAKQFVDTVNRHGGDARLVLLPEIGIKGNTHAPFADLNNIEIADHLETFLQTKSINVRDEPHGGPKQKQLAGITIPLE